MASFLTVNNRRRGSLPTMRKLLNDTFLGNLAHHYEGIARQLGDAALARPRIL